ncbi:MAG: hypothetical protein JWO68_3132 [Actinomycetia bacterium]|nr:hypothetical protein [Actinomycetes bacterium]
MNVSAAVAPATQHPAQVVKAPRPPVGKDADGDTDGTKPGKVDMRDAVKPANRVDVRA